MSFIQEKISFKLAVLLILEANKNQKIEFNKMSEKLFIKSPNGAQQSCFYNSKTNKLSFVAQAWATLIQSKIVEKSEDIADKEKILIL